MDNTLFYHGKVFLAQYDCAVIIFGEPDHYHVVSSCVTFALFNGHSQLNLNVYFNRNILTYCFKI